MNVSGVGRVFWRKCDQGLVSLVDSDGYTLLVCETDEDHADRHGPYHLICIDPEGLAGDILETGSLENCLGAAEEVYSERDQEYVPEEMDELD